MKYLLFIIPLLSFACDDLETPLQTKARYKKEEKEVWDGPCAEKAVLLATTAGSPNEIKCPNRLHKMRVEVATHPSNEEAAALVFCECQKETTDH